VEFQAFEVRDGKLDSEECLPNFRGQGQVRIVNQIVCVSGNIFDGRVPYMYIELSSDN
jgi:hypothetical protein